MNIFFYKKNVIVTVLVLFGISSVFLFQNCSEVIPLTSEGEFIPEPGDQGDGTGDNIGDNNGDGGDSGDTGGGNTSDTYDNSDPYKCDYNDDGVVDFVTRSGGTAVNTRPAGMELIQPQGFTMYNKTWASQFNGRAFGTPTSIVAPIGSWSVNNANASTMYITIPFVMEESAIHRIDWQSAQSIPKAGYYVTPGQSYAEEVLVSVSPCAGDIRPKDRSSSIQWLKGCRVDLAAQGAIVFSDDQAAACQLQLDRTYWLTLKFKCRTGDNCEANFSYSP